MHLRLRDFALRSFLPILLFALAACSHDPAPKKAAAVPVGVARVERRSIPERVTAVGTVEAINSVAIKSLVDGQLLQSFVKDGGDVKKGQMLFRIDPHPALAQLAQANAALAKDIAARELAGAQVARYKPIAAQHYISADQMQQYVTAFDAAAASVKVDQANVDAVKLTLGYTDIRAPIDGRAGRILVQPGNLVKANDTQALLTINQLAPIFVSFAVPGQQVDRVRAAQAKGKLAVTATGGDGGGDRIGGELAFVDNAIDPTTNTVKLRARFDNTDERLWPGQFVNITLTLGHDAAALAVPDAAVKAGPNGNYVFVVSNDTAEQREVTATRSVDGSTMIAKGLAEGETVVIDGQSRLVDGAKVKIIDGSGAETGK